MKPLFIPLRREYFTAFAEGRKTNEYRLYGPRWNERTCHTGRPVTLSLGYGKKHRLHATIESFRASTDPLNITPAFRACYPDAEYPKVAIITLKLEPKP